MGHSVIVLVFKWEYNGLVAKIQTKLIPHFNFFPKMM